MQMEEYILLLLDEHECVIIPDFGGFLKQKNKSKYIPQTNTFIPPTERISFNAKLTENDGVLVHFIAQKENLKYTQAKEWVGEYVRVLKDTLHNGNNVFLEGIGNLFFENSKLRFVVASNHSLKNKAFYGLPFLHVIPAAKEISKGSTLMTDELTKQSSTSSSVFWKIAAMVLLFFNISILVTHQQFQQNINVSSLYPFNNKQAKPEYSQRNETLYGVSIKQELDSLLYSVSIFEQSKVVEENLSQVNSHPINNDLNIHQPYQVIIGCFKEENNAQEQVFEFSKKGINSYYFYHQGLYKVSVYSTHDNFKAIDKMLAVKQQFSVQPWILSMN